MSRPSPSCRDASPASRKMPRPSEATPMTSGTRERSTLRAGPPTFLIRDALTDGFLGTYSPLSHMEHLIVLPPTWRVQKPPLDRVGPVQFSVDCRYLARPEGGSACGSLRWPEPSSSRDSWPGAG